MKIINRIMISSALLVFLSLVTLLAALAAIISIALQFFPENAGQEALSKYVFQVEDALNSFDMSSGDWVLLDSRLSEYNYNLLVIENENTTFSSLNDSQDTIIDSLKLIAPSPSALAGKIDMTTFVVDFFGAHRIFAVEDMIINNSADIGGFLGSLLVLSFFAIIIILLLSQLFTRKMAGKLLRPLHALLDGAKRIESSDLSTPIAYSGKDEFAPVCIAFDHMQEHLMQEKEKTAAYERARTDLVAGISHDLRTPLTSVKGYIKGLRDGVANTAEKREQYLSIAYDKACDMESLLQRLFDFSNLEAGNVPLSFSNDDLGEFGRRFAETVRGELNQKEIALYIEITDVPHPVRMDAKQMRRVLLNLMENAVKYANIEHLTLRISVWRERDMEHLLFTDNGKGVPEDHLPHLFERFWRGDAARTMKNGESSGLGLYIVKYIVEAHGGYVEAQNNHGLQIKISLPCGKEETL